MRLDKYLSNSGKGSRKEIKLMLKDGSVTVNGKTVKDPAFKIDENSDTIIIGNETVQYKKFVYLMLNKPSGYVSAVFDKRLPVVTSLVPECYAHFDVFPVGRLDIDTEGLLILTNDGALTHRVLSPKSHVDKMYYVECESELKSQDITAFEQGVVLDDGYKTMPARLTILDDAKKAYLIIKEGKFHQVKRMMEAVGNKVVYLKRVKMGSLMLDENLEKGQVRELTECEVKMLEERDLSS